MEQENKWDIDLYVNKAGKCPVEETLSTIKSKDPEFHTRILKKLSYLRQHSIGALLKANELENLKNGLWELKVHVSKEFRMLGVLEKGIFCPIYVSLSAFRKKEQRIKKKEIKIALQRLLDYKKL